MTETLSPSTTEETKFLQNFTRKNDENQPSQNHPLSAADSSPSVTTNTSPLDIQLDPTESKPSPMTQSVPHISFKGAHLQDMVMDLEISLSVPIEDLELTYNDSITSIDTNLSMQGARKNLCPIVSLSVTNHCLHSL